MRNKVNIFIGNDQVELFDDENIVLNLSVQNIRDISKIFTDFSQDFSVPATPTNNQIFDHYYRTDIVGQDDWRLRAPGRIEINGLPFRFGSIELEKVLLRGNNPYSYNIMFYGAITNLTDLFGEDYLYDLDLSAYNHTYDQATIHSGFADDALLPVIYPMITPKDVWYYNPDSSDHGYNNIHFHGVNEDHGVQYYNLKPAIELQRIISAIETKYGVGLAITGVNDYDKLFMWCHRNAGYMYKDLPSGNPWTKLLAPNNYAAVSPDWWNYADSQFEPQAEDYYRVQVNIDPGAYTNQYTIGAFVNGVLVEQAVGTGIAAVQLKNILMFTGDVLYVAIKPSTNEAVTLDVDRIQVVQELSPLVKFADAKNNASQSIAGYVDISSLMPEQKVSDFLAGFCKMFNLVIIPTSSTTFDLLPLNDWYAAGTDVDISKYMDIAQTSVERPELFKQVNFKYNDTGAIVGNEYRLTNNVGYGDLRSNFVFDTSEELSIELPFDQMLFSFVDDITNGFTNILAGYSVTRELETYIGSPYIFYVNGYQDVSANSISFVDESEVITGDTSVEVNQIWYCNSSSLQTNGATTYSTNFGADLDPYFLQSVTNSLYNVYWRDYISDLYDPSRRLVIVKAILPIGQMLNFDLKNKVIWRGQRWIVNSVALNLSNGEADFELLNDV